MKLYYRLSEGTDPEERLEDAAMWKALHDEYGGGISLLEPNESWPDDGVVWGRARNSSIATNVNIGRPKSFLPYWDDPVFLSRCGRSFKVCSFSEAETEVAKLHAEGKDAFLKALRTKYYTARIPVRAEI